MSQIRVTDLKVANNDLTIVNAARTKTHLVILEAYRRGYRVTEAGEIVSPYGGTLKLSTGKSQRYPTITIANYMGSNFGLPAHMFAAFCFHKERSFDPSLVVRHKNANKLDISRDNILLGTHSENELDKPAVVRSRSARLARAAQEKTPINAKLSVDQVLKIRKIYADAGGRKLPSGVATAMTKEFNVSRTVLIKVKNRQYYGDIP